MDGPSVDLRGAGCVSPCRRPPVTPVPPPGGDRPRSSRPGSRWPCRTPPGPPGRTLLRDATACAGRWYVVGGVVDPAGETRPAAWTSPDGTSWVPCRWRRGRSTAGSTCSTRRPAGTDGWRRSGPRTGARTAIPAPAPGGRRGRHAAGGGGALRAVRRAARGQCGPVGGRSAGLVDRRYPDRRRGGLDVPGRGWVRAGGGCRSWPVTSRADGGVRRGRRAVGLAGGRCAAAARWYRADAAGLVLGGRPELAAGRAAGAGRAGAGATGGGARRRAGGGRAGAGSAFGSWRLTRGAGGRAGGSGRPDRGSRRWSGWWRAGSGWWR